MPWFLTISPSMLLKVEGAGSEREGSNKKKNGEKRAKCLFATTQLLTGFPSASALPKKLLRWQCLSLLESTRNCFLADVRMCKEPSDLQRRDSGPSVDIEI